VTTQSAATVHTTTGRTAVSGNREMSTRIVTVAHTTKTDVVYEMKQDGEHTNFDPQCTLQRREAQ
jgi:hypothetical protein